MPYPDTVSAGKRSWAPCIRFSDLSKNLTFFVWEQHIFTIFASEHWLTLDCKMAAIYQLSIYYLHYQHTLAFTIWLSLSPFTFTLRCLLRFWSEPKISSILKALHFKETICLIIVVVWVSMLYTHCSNVVDVPIALVHSLGFSIYMIVSINVKLIIKDTLRHYTHLYMHNLMGFVSLPLTGPWLCYFDIHRDL